MARGNCSNGKKRARENAANAAAEKTSTTDRMDEDAEDSDGGDDTNSSGSTLRPTSTFTAAKSLLRQLFDVDASLFDTSALADLILSQPTIGSAVKVEGEENDPFSILTVPQHPRAPRNESLKEADGVGLVLSERLINVPSEISAPMSPTSSATTSSCPELFHEVESTHDADKRKPKKARGERVTHTFTPRTNSSQARSGTRQLVYTKEGDVASDSKRAFQEVGIQTIGHMLLVEGSKFEGAVKEINAVFRPQQGLQ
ncbi:hypothetical protein G6O67_000955 [Ophiocordyceps sinensis]|uniref:Uncharacterized protein n=1 Tax=Ophiocordyceps sinensis TaxID=72228 RepID=A0A8H4Q014_9HYPO|nr:hypothetical protein G6O67_000955 [Ophiocordyceps sinensis]